MDEPTTALMSSLKRTFLTRSKAEELAIGIVYVSHDLAVVGNLADRIAVMYAGWIIEEGSTETILASAPSTPTRKDWSRRLPDHIVARQLQRYPGVAPRRGEQSSLAVRHRSVASALREG